MPVFQRDTPMPVSAAALYAWHMHFDAFQRLAPPWEHIRVVEAPPAIEDGARLRFQMRLAPGLWVDWQAVHRDFVPGAQFADVQERGPFASWRHVHWFRDAAAGGVLEDEITWAPPLGALGRWVAGGYISRSLARTFRYRHARTRDDLRRHAAFADRDRLRVLVTGASGTVGTALSSFLRTGGHTVLPLVRRTPEEGEIAWNVRKGTIDVEALEGADAVVHLAGAGISDKRWSEARKAEIRDSRVDGTRLLCEALARLERPPKVLVSGSAVGFYGGRGDEVLTESAGPGTGFLAEVCRAWEDETAPAREAGIRVVNLRTGVVMTQRGGALKQMLPIFALGAGGPLGNGRQYFPWIALDDLVGAIHHALYDDRLAGPMNAVAPNPVPQKDFARTLGRVLRRPAFAPAPAFAIRLLMGEMGEEALLQGQRAVPEVLQKVGFEFSYPDLDAALRFELGR